MAFDRRVSARFFPGRILAAVTTVVFALLMAVALTAPATGQDEDATDEVVVLTGEHKDVQFLAGRTVRVAATIADDVFAAGRDVTLDGATAENAVLAGYDVEQRGGRVSDMIAAGANVTIGGIVADDVVGIGRGIRLADGARAGGDVRVAGEHVEIEGDIGGNLRAAGRRITISGEISGKADLFAERIVITSDAVITGDLIWRSGTEPEIAAGATIGGETRRIETDLTDFEKIGWTILGIGLVILVAWILAMLLLVVIVHTVFTRFFADATEALEARPWPNLGIGVAALLIGSAVGGLLFWSVIGMPLGAAMFVIVALVVLFGLVTVSRWLGLQIRARLSDGSAPMTLANQIGWLVLGTVIIGLLGMVPVVGNVLIGLGVAAGAGAAGGELWGRLRAA